MSGRQQKQNSPKGLDELILQVEQVRRRIAFGNVIGNTADRDFSAAMSWIPGVGGFAVA